ncbi:MAG TPA: 16S rRNA (adenine(1518)-N(6)/adenine(1519)-N(6))-dimethyltransferase, partial [Ruminococcaceae bacterium]|nr:16S rRNA (adenine(1518)-N(6)/adenine(1519)-N(6))-dimethyltransferase [Oscillospiraceae bacterium]
AVIKLKILEKPPVEVRDERAFFRLVKCCFSQRRKTLVNAVSNTAGTDKDELRAALRALGLPETVRGEQLTMEQLAALSDII